MHVRNFIGGEFYDTAYHIPSINPATGETIGQIPDSDASDVDKAVTAAKAAFPEWRAKSAEERSQYLLRLADLIEKNLEVLAKLESDDQGKPFENAKAQDISKTAYNFRFFASAYLHPLETANQMPKLDIMNYTLREPVGIAGLISPWNFPIYLLSFKIAPCLASGCVCICKPSELTSLSAYKLCELVQEAGFPNGVVNMVFGTGPKVGEALTLHPDIPCISFTGSSLVGQRISEKAAQFCKKISLELGGKNAAIVFSNCNLEKAVRNCIMSSFYNQGEVCLATSRIFVQQEIYEKFLEHFVAIAKKFRVGDPAIPSSQIGALVSKEHHQKVMSYIDLARSTGATFQCGPDVPEEWLSPRTKNGYFVAPTILTDVTDDSRLMQEEIFGPVTCVTPFKDEEEVIRRTNNVQYGLCASVHTEDLSVAHRVASKIEVGIVWVNTWIMRSLDMPFGGVKASGSGREGYEDSLHFFTNRKTVTLKL